MTLRMRQMDKRVGRPSRPTTNERKRGKDYHYRRRSERPFGEYTSLYEDTTGLDHRNNRTKPRKGLSAGGIRRYEGFAATMSGRDAA